MFWQEGDTARGFVMPSPFSTSHPAHSIEDVELIGYTGGARVRYSTVAAALKGLHARPNVNFSTENGWTIATDETAYTIWSFAPASYPAYPAVVKRQVVSQGSGSSISIEVSCEASKIACDDLVRTFAAINGFQTPK